MTIHYKLTYNEANHSAPGCTQANSLTLHLIYLDTVVHDFGTFLNNVESLEVIYSGSDVHDNTEFQIQVKQVHKHLELAPPSPTDSTSENGSCVVSGTTTGIYTVTIKPPHLIGANTSAQMNWSFVNSTLPAATAKLDFFQPQKLKIVVKRQPTADTGCT